MLFSNIKITRTKVRLYTPLFLNDLEEFLLTKDIVGLKSITDELKTELEIYLKIFVMLYADDTILLADIILYILPFMLLSNNL
jgi:hypothetical protein